MSTAAGFLTVEEAAARLGVDPSTVYRAIRAGRLTVGDRAVDVVRINKTIRIPAAALEPHAPATT